MVLDFLHFCRTNGLARSASAPPEKNSPRVETLKQSNGITPEQKKTEEASNETQYLSSLCSFLQDKSKFIRDSRYVSSNIRTNRALTESQEEHKENNFQQSRASSKALIPRTLTEKQIAAKTAQHLVNGKQNKNLPTRDKTKISADEKLKTEKEKDVSTTEVSSDNATFSLARSDKNSSTYPKRKQPSWEWNKMMEEDLIRLYESEDTSTSLPTPGVVQWTQNRENVERKMSSSEQTPSYVLALANLFRKRVQVSKLHKHLN